MPVRVVAMSLPLGSSGADGEVVSFRVVWKKTSYDVAFPLDEKALKLKEHIQTLTGMVVCVCVHMHS